MPKYQYMISTSGLWPTYFGNAFIAFMNESGSNKKMTFRSIDVFVNTALNSDATKTSCSVCSLYRGTAPLLGGETISPNFKFDSSMTLPSTVAVKRHSIATNYSDRVRRVDICRRSAAVGTQNMHYSYSMYNRFNGHIYRSSLKATNTTVEPLFVRQNEAYALVAESVYHNTYPLRISLVLSVNGKSVGWDFTTVPMPGVSILSVENTGPDTVRILHIGVSEVGTNDTAFIRLVPIGQIYPQDLMDSSKMPFTITKMNTQYPNLSALKCLGDIAFVPRGTPAVAIAEGSAGTPKGMNYLHTRDFDGPCFRTFLPELSHIRSAGDGMPDMRGFSYSFNYSDMLTRKANITINPGEGVALVGSAETAVGVQAAYSGWPNLTFQAIVDVEPFKIPTIAITGMVVGSRWRVERLDGQEVASGVTETGSESFQYTDEDTPLELRLKVRKASSSPYYKPYEIQFQLTDDGITIPVSQILDP